MWYFTWVLGLGLAVGCVPPEREIEFIRQMDMVRALAARPKLLLLDEPACGLNHEEVEKLGELICNIRDHLGITVLLVEHQMNLVMGISDDILVMEYGRPIATGAPAEIRSNPKVIKAYLGEE